MIRHTKDRHPLLRISLNQLRSLVIAHTNTASIKANVIPLSIPHVGECETLSRFRALRQTESLRQISSVQSTADCKRVTIACTLLMQDPALSNIVVFLRGLSERSTVTIICEREAIELESEVSAFC